MTDSPLSPRLLRGAIVGVDIFNPIASVIVFQYNPDTMTRRIRARTATGQRNGDRREALKLTGPPEETITLSMEVDQSDQPLATGTSVLGVHPPLAALEMLVYPKVAAVIKNMVFSAAGNKEILQPNAPLTLFVWGPARVVPVRVTDMNITEQQYDPLLNPTRAKVDLTLNVLSYQDLKITNPGQAIFFAHQIIKELLATSNVIGSAVNLGVSLKL
jgi:hypothetical protein